MSIDGAQGHIGRNLLEGEVDESVYTLNLLGYAVIREFLRPEEVAAALQIVRHVPYSPRDGKFTFFNRDAIYLKLMVHSGILMILERLAGPWFRFDHAFGIRMPPGSEIKQGIHGGQYASQGSFWSMGEKENRIHSSIKVSFALTGVEEGDGGFVCIPGSHQIARPSNIELTTVGPHCINPALAAGDVLLFTETLLHGSRPWRGREDRIALIYTFCPGHVAWRSPDQVALPMERSMLTPLESRLLRPPFVSDYREPDDSHPTWPRSRRTRTLRGDD